MGKTKEIRGFKRGIICILFLLGMVLSLGGRANAAETITSGQIVTGRLEDSRVSYQFVVPEDGALALDVLMDCEESPLYYSYRYNLKIWDSSNCYIDTEQYSDVIKCDYRLYIGLNKGETVTIDLGYKYKATYSITCNFDARKDYESEGNNYPENADVLSDEHANFGDLFTKNDADYWTFEIDKPQAVTLSVGPGRVSSNNDMWMFTLYSNKEGTDMILGIDVGWTGWSSPLILSKGTYVLKMQGGESFSSNMYRIKLDKKNVANIKPKLKAKGIQQGIDLSWNKTKEASGYIIECSPTKKFRQVKKYTSYDPEKTIKHLNEKKYYVRVRPYFTTLTEEKVYGAYSSVKMVHVK